MPRFVFLSAAFILICFSCLAGNETNTVASTSTEDKTVVQLPVRVDGIKVGGGGRYLLLHFKSLRKIALFDLTDNEIVHYFPAEDDQSYFAVGSTKLIVFSGSKNLITRWDLGSREKELSQIINYDEPICHVLMGAASEGPIFVGGGDDHSTKILTINLKSLKGKELPVNIRQIGDSLSSDNRARVSADGRTLSFWRATETHSGIDTLSTVGGKWTYYQSEAGEVGHIMPSPNGQYLYTANGIYDSEAQLIGEIPTSKTYYIPATYGPYFLSVANATRYSSTEKSRMSVRLHKEGDPTPFSQVQNLEPFFQPGDRYGTSKLTLEQRLMFIPDRNVIVQLGASGEELFIHRFDLETALKGAGSNYLIVKSRPPEKVQVGETLSYQIDTSSEAANIQYQLESSPTGMALSKSGFLTWKPTSEALAENKVVVQVSDASGEQVRHEFSLRVVGLAGQETVPAMNVADANPASTIMEDAKSLPDVVLENGRVEIELPGVADQILHAAHGRLMILHFAELKQIAVFDITKQKIVKMLPTSSGETLIAAGANHLLVVDQSNSFITSFDLTSFEKVLAKPFLEEGKIIDIGLGSSSEGPAMIRWSTGTERLDPCTFDLIDQASLERVDVKWGSRDRPQSAYFSQHEIRASADGKTFTVSGLGLFSLRGNRLILERRASRDKVIPAQTGRHLIVGNRLYDRDMKQLNPGVVSNQREFLLPATTGNYYLRYTSGAYSRTRNGSTQANPTVRLMMFGVDAPLADVAGFEPVMPRREQTRGDEKRVMFVPEANVAVMIGQNDDRLVMLQLDVKQTLEQSGADYLFVVSRAPGFAEVGKTYSYQLNVMSKAGGLRFSIASGPEGMSISNSGMLQWDVPLVFGQKSLTATVSVKDRVGQETLHNIMIDLPTALRPSALKAKLAAEEREKQKEREREAFWQKQRAQR